MNTSNGSTDIMNIATATSHGISTIACVVAVVALFFFKMYHYLIYRLVLYTLVALTIHSLCGMILFSTIYIIELTVTLILDYITVSCLYTAYILMACTAYYLSEMAVHHQSKKSCLFEFNFVLISLGTSMILQAKDFIAPTIHLFAVINLLFFMVMLIVLLLTLYYTSRVTIILCLRAYGHNAAYDGTRLSYQKALKETVAYW